MIPRVCAEQVGQPLPLFIKWGTSATTRPSRRLPDGQHARRRGLAHGLER